MSDEELDYDEVEKFKEELNSALNKISKHLMMLALEPGNNISSDLFTVTLLQIASSMAVQIGLDEEYFLKCANICFKNSAKQEIKKLHSDILRFKNELNNNKSKLN